MDQGVEAGVEAVVVGVLAAMGPVIQAKRPRAVLKIALLVVMAKARLAVVVQIRRPYQVRPLGNGVVPARFAMSFPGEKRL